MNKNEVEWGLGPHRRTVAALGHPKNQHQQFRGCSGGSRYMGIPQCHTRGHRGNGGCTQPSRATDRHTPPRTAKHWHKQIYSATPTQRSAHSQSHSNRLLQSHTRTHTHTHTATHTHPHPHTHTNADSSHANATHASEGPICIHQTTPSIHSHTWRWIKLFSLLTRNPRFLNVLAVTRQNHIRHASVVARSHWALSSRFCLHLGTCPSS